MADSRFGTPPAPSPGMPYGPPGEPVPSHLAWAILVTMFCCLPFGIVAIVYAARVPSMLAVGNTAGAIDSSRKARMWSLIGTICGAVFILLYLLLVVVAIFAGVLSG